MAVGELDDVCLIKYWHLLPMTIVTIFANLPSTTSTRVTILWMRARHSISFFLSFFSFQFFVVVARTLHKFIGGGTQRPSLSSTQPCVGHCGVSFGWRVACCLLPICFAVLRECWTNYLEVNASNAKRETHVEHGTHRRTCKLKVN